MFSLVLFRNNLHKLAFLFICAFDIENAHTQNVRDLKNKGEDSKINTFSISILCQRRSWKFCLLREEVKEVGWWNIKHQ